MDHVSCSMLSPFSGEIKLVSNNKAFISRPSREDKEKWYDFGRDFAKRVGEHQRGI